MATNSYKIIMHPRDQGWRMEVEEEGGSTVPSEISFLACCGVESFLIRFGFLIIQFLFVVA